MQRIVHLDRASVVADFRRPAFVHDWIDYPQTAPQQVVERLRGASIAITNKVPLPAAVIEALPELRMIAVAATGTNIIDLEACRRRGIVVSNIRGYAEHTVPEHVFALLLALSRNLFAWRATIQAGAWQAAEQFCLFDHPIPRSARGDAGHHRRRQPRQWSRPSSARPSACAYCAPSAKGAATLRPGLHRLRRGAGGGRRDQPALPAQRRHPAPDRRGRTAGDENLGAADQHGARRASSTKRRWPGRCAKAGLPAPVSTC